MTPAERAAQIRMLRQLADELEAQGEAPPAAESGTQPVEKWDPKRVRALRGKGKVNDLDRQWAKNVCHRKGIRLRSEAS